MLNQHYIILILLEYNLITFTFFNIIIAIKFNIIFEYYIQILCSIKGGNTNKPICSNDIF